MNTLFANIYLALETVAGKLRREEKGATATEYSLLVAFIALLIIAGVTLFGTALDNWFRELAGRVDAW